MNCLFSHHLMAFTYFFLHLISWVIILGIEKCVSMIWLQLVLHSFCPVAILESTNVYASIIFPPLSLSWDSPLFVSLSWIALPSWHITLSHKWIHKLSPPLRIELTKLTAICWSSILHSAEWKSPTVTVYTCKRSIMEQLIIENSNSSKRITLALRILVSN